MGKIKSYCATVGLFSVDWKAELTKCCQGKTEEFPALLNLASSWATDPVACLELLIPRHANHLNKDSNELIVDTEGGGVPNDKYLVDMSIAFYDRLEHEEYEYCLQLLKDIESYATAKYKTEEENS